MALRISALWLLCLKVLKKYALRCELPYPKNPKWARRLPTILTPEEMTWLIDLAKEPVPLHHAPDHVFLGLRRGELCRLKVSDIDSQRMVIAGLRSGTSHHCDVTLSALRYRTLEQAAKLYDSLIDRVASMPGVQSVAVADSGEVAGGAGQSQARINILRRKPPRGPRVAKQLVNWLGNLQNLCCIWQQEREWAWRVSGLAGSAVDALFRITWTFSCLLQQRDSCLMAMLVLRSSLLGNRCWFLTADPAFRAATIACVNSSTGGRVLQQDPWNERRADCLEHSGTDGPLSAFSPPYATSELMSAAWCGGPKSRLRRVQRRRSR